MTPSGRFDRGVRRVMRPFSAAEKRAIEDAYRAKATLACPSCAVALDERPVFSPRAQVSYVRERVVLSCPRCRGHLVLDCDN